MKVMDNYFALMRYYGGGSIVIVPNSDGMRRLNTPMRIYLNTDGSGQLERLVPHILWQ